VALRHSEPTPMIAVISCFIHKMNCFFSSCFWPYVHHLSNIINFYFIVDLWFILYFLAFFPPTLTSILPSHLVTLLTQLPYSLISWPYLPTITNPLTYLLSILSWLNLYLLKKLHLSLVKPLPLAKPFYSMAKPLFLGKTFISF
jgi:hypothetical protein